MPTRWNLELAKIEASKYNTLSELNKQSRGLSNWLKRNGLLKSICKELNIKIHTYPSQKDFIEKAIKIHGNTYSYENVKYLNKKTKVKINCKKHGIFEQLPSLHLKDSGCTKCFYEKLSRNKTEKDQVFIEKAIKVHGDKYNYDFVNYRGSKIKVDILCKKHGKFKQTPSNHLRGSGCNKCVLDKQSINYSKTTEKFIKESIHIHGKKYDYSNTKYINSKKKIKILCTKHGEFEQYPKNHLNGCGCNKCAAEKMSIAKSKTNEEFIQDSIDVHGDTYSYEVVEYTNAKTKVIITCKKHGHFEQLPKNHLSGNGCPTCNQEASIINLSEINTKTNSQFIEDAINVHGNKFDYKFVDYKSSDSKVKIICKDCNKSFNQRPSGHLAGYGCSNCALYGFNLEKEAILYYIRIEKDGEIVYKVGITNNSVEKRFGKAMMKYITIIHTWKFDIGKKAYKLEQEFLSDYSYAKYKGPNILESGNTELFIDDVLMLDKKID